MDSSGTHAVEKERFQFGQDGEISSKVQPDVLAAEEPLEIRVEGKSVAVVMRTPGHDEELVTGFLVTEGIITKAADLFEVSVCPAVIEEGEGNVMDVLLRNPDAAKLESLTRHVFSSSSCGICGKATIDSVFCDFSPVSSSVSVTAETLLSLPGTLRQAQENFDQTGGLHASAIFDAQGQLLMLREDVGRHNALDKVIGQALLADDLPLSEAIVLMSGRLSFEILQKSLAAGIPIIAGISAPSSLAVDFAGTSGQTVIGFLRERGFNVYAGKQRVLKSSHED
ncbi:MAG: formate dehydrogenase accessory sulfurtransferase FdhD [Verrucomicrobiota bacterium]